MLGKQRLKEGGEPPGRVISGRAIDVLDDSLPVEPEALAAKLRELADEGLGDRVGTLGVLLGVLAPEEAVRLLGGFEQRQHVDRERGLAQAAQALEHEHAIAPPDSLPEPVQVGAPADEAGRQDAPGADILERAVEDVLRASPPARRDRAAEGEIRPAMIEDQLRPGERVRVARKVRGGRDEGDIARDGIGDRERLGQRPSGEVDGEAGRVPLGDRGVKRLLGPRREFVHDRAVITHDLNHAFAVQPGGQALRARLARLGLARGVAVATGQVEERRQFAIG